jgi:hypothetical protein
MEPGHDPGCPWPHVGEMPAGTRFRTGADRRPRTIYLQVGAEPAEDDPAVGMMDTPGRAALAVEAMNVYVERGHSAMGTWMCMVCGEERPDIRISVMTRPMLGAEARRLQVRVHVRYCNDRPACARHAAADGPWLGPPVTARPVVEDGDGAGRAR